MNENRNWRPLLNNFVGSATITTALLVYFGWRRSQSIATTMGYDPTLLNLSAQDYTLRAIAPVSILLFVVFGLAILWRALHEAFANRTSLLRNAGPRSRLDRWSQTFAEAAGSKTWFVSFLGWMLALVASSIALAITAAAEIVPHAVTLLIVIGAGLLAYSSWFEQFALAEPSESSSTASIEAHHLMSPETDAQQRHEIASPNEPVTATDVETKGTADGVGPELSAERPAVDTSRRFRSVAPLNGNRLNVVQVFLAIALFFAISTEASQSGIRQANENWRRVESGEAPLAILTSQMPLAIAGVKKRETDSGFTYTGLVLLFTENANHFLTAADGRNSRELFVVPAAGVGVSLDRDRSVPCHGFEDVEVGARYTPGDMMWSGGVRYLVGESSEFQGAAPVESFAQAVAGPYGTRIELRNSNLEVVQTATPFGRWEVMYEQVGALGVEASASDDIVTGSTFPDVAAFAPSMGAQGLASGTFWIDATDDETAERLLIGGTHLYLDC